ncbi:MAG: AI-2E family transporter [Thalassobaculum sp.]|uniref:AI-2E family transporter n=1 Tax=Thalassobaculum sp. TaxID=2022740 RepID=UPI0032EE6A4B
MTRRERSLFWALLLAAVTFGLYVLRDVLVPFVAGMAVAYLLDPVVDRLERLRIGRGLATFAVLFGFFAVAIGLVLLLIPLLQTQVERLAAVLPGYVELVRDRLGPLLAHFDEDIDRQAALQKITGMTGDLVSWVGNVIGRVIQGGFAIANILSLLLITPIVSFYLLRDWDRMVATVDSWLPREQAGTVRAQIGEVDRTLSAFVRGQGTVCLMLGVFYAAGLTLAGLDFGLVIGLFSGLISFVPFVGALLGGLLSVGLALAQFDSWQPILAVAAVFAAGQVIEGNFLTPNLVGDAVGLHPVWVIFGLLAGGTLFGFVGVLLAVPTAAVVGVMARFALAQYLASPLHLHGIPPADDADSQDDRAGRD